MHFTHAKLFIPKDCCSEIVLRKAKRKKKKENIITYYSNNETFLQVLTFFLLSVIFDCIHTHTHNRYTVNRQFEWKTVIWINFHVIWFGNQSKLNLSNEMKCTFRIKWFCQFNKFVLDQLVLKVKLKLLIVCVN